MFGQRWLIKKKKFQNKRGKFWFFRKFCHSLKKLFRHFCKTFCQYMLNLAWYVSYLLLHQKKEKKKGKKTMYIRHNDTTKEKINRQFQHIGIWISFELQSQFLLCSHFRLITSFMKTRSSQLFFQLLYKKPIMNYFQRISCPVDCMP